MSTWQFDFVSYIEEHKRFSLDAFGPYPRMLGVVDHISKELEEIKADPYDLFEWVDVMILALDGAIRSGHSAEEICDALAYKQRKNKNRTWPDWRTADPEKAIEHDRSKD